jgi:hypothetical protein
MAKKNWKKDTEEEDDLFADEEQKKPRFIKYFIEFEGQTIQPGSIQRITQTETANEESLGGEDDCMDYNLVLHTREYPFTLYFKFPSEESRADALVLLHAQMRDNRISIQ